MNKLAPAIGFFSPAPLLAGCCHLIGPCLGAGPRLDGAECENLETLAKEADRGSKGSFSPPDLNGEEPRRWGGRGDGDAIVELLMERWI